MPVAPQDHHAPSVKLVVAKDDAVLVVIHPGSTAVQHPEVSDPTGDVPLELDISKSQSEEVCQEFAGEVAPAVLWVRSPEVLLHDPKLDRERVFPHVHIPDGELDPGGIVQGRIHTGTGGLRL